MPQTPLNRISKPDGTRTLNLRFECTPNVKHVCKPEWAIKKFAPDLVLGRDYNKFDYEWKDISDTRCVMLIAVYIFNPAYELPKDMKN